jgi:hypothetical protein
VNEYEKVHSSDAGCPPVAAVKERFNVVDPPGFAEPDERKRPTLCERQGIETRPQTNNTRVQPLRVCESMSVVNKTAFGEELVGVQAFSSLLLRLRAITKFGFDIQYKTISFNYFDSDCWHATGGKFD